MTGPQLAERVKAHREAAGLTRAALGRRVNKSASHLRALESLRFSFDRATLAAIIAALPTLATVPGIGAGR